MEEDQSTSGIHVFAMLSLLQAGTETKDSWGGAQCCAAGPSYAHSIVGFDNRFVAGSCFQPVPASTVAANRVVKQWMEKYLSLLIFLINIYLFKNDLLKIQFISFCFDPQKNNKIWIYSYALNSTNSGMHMKK